MTHAAELLALRNDLTAVLERVERMINQPSPVDGMNILEMPRTVAIETVLCRRGTAMSPVEIWADLQAAGRPNDPKMEVQVTTYDLWKRGRIDKVGRGQYKAKP